MYLIKRKRDGRPIAGIFAPIKTEEMARAVLARWKYNWPDDQFTIEDARRAQGVAHKRKEPARRAQGRRGAGQKGLAPRLFAAYN